MARRYFPVAAFAVLLVAIQLATLFTGTAYHLTQLTMTAYYSLIIVGLCMLIGYAGQISLGHAGFFGLGAYGSAILTARYGWPPAAALAATTAGVALLALVVGRPILKLKGHYLAMATLGMGIIISIVVVTEDRLTGGPDGMSVALTGLRRVLDFVGIDYHLRDFDDVKAARGF